MPDIFDNRESTPRDVHKELSALKIRYENLYENFPHICVCIDSEGIITSCNRICMNILNAGRGELKGKNFLSFFTGDDRREIEKIVKNSSKSDFLPAGRKTFTIMRNPDSTPLLLSLKAVFFSGETDILVIMDDVTEEVRLQEEQKLARQQMFRSARLASVGTLASGVAHEINNPLTAILGFSSALLRRLQHNEPIDKDELNEYLVIINREALRCRDIVENLSKFARESNVLLSDVNLLGCVKEAVNLTHDLAANADISVDIEVDASIAVHSNADRLRQVFTNIITNCIDFCPAGSKVTIKNIPAKGSERFCRIQISDNGPGIDSESLSKVFNPFFTTKGVGYGTGMGLAMCYKLMDECNGHIDILSEPGGGTTVVLDLPFA